MSWQLAAFALLFLALAAGFAWYERTRPDARVIALVATLAAFAALGRIAFAALPNIKPTTDIVLISGYAIGGAPGFAIGALAGLTSNFFFGQGPWTPWQMAAWGATGLVGAGLGALTHRRARRITLALVCAVAGFAFTVVQDIGDWVTYSDHSAGALGIYVSKGLGFDAVHGAGCLVFALAFGPALARSLTRFVSRLSVTWRIAPSEAALPILLAAALLAAAPSAHAASGQVAYLESAQNSDGGLGPAPGQPSASLEAGWAALGLAAEGIDLRSVSRSGPSLSSYIAGNAGSADPGDIERNILALAAAGADTTGLVAELRGQIKADGSVSEQTNLTAFAILALRAAGASPPSASITWLARQQDSDGGFGYATAGGLSDVDDTGATLEALAGSGDASAVGGAIRFIRSQQNADGGFPAEPGQDSNAQSTAWAMQGLIAVGVDPGAGAAHYLQGLVAPDGHIAYSHTSDQTPVWVTAQAMMALAGKPLPIATPHTATPTRPRATLGRGASHPPRKLHRRSADRTKPAAGTIPLNHLAGDAGIFIALTLAPLR